MLFMWVENYYLSKEGAERQEENQEVLGGRNQKLRELYVWKGGQQG